MEQILLNGLNVEQLLEKIGKLLESKLSKTETPQKSQPTLLSRVEVSNLLKISLPTLHEWTKLQWLKSYKIGNRVLYKLEEVEEALQNKSIHKHNRISHSM